MRSSIRGSRRISALLSEEAGEFATHQELVVAGARRKLRSLSKEHAELLDQLLVIAAGRDYCSPVPAAVHTAYVTVRLTRRGDDGLFSDLPETLGMPYVTGPEHVAHLCRVTDIDRHLDDLDWLRASAAAYVRWGDARVRQALDDGRLVEAACRAARWSGRDRLTYSLLRLSSGLRILLLSAPEAGWHESAGPVTNGSAVVTLPQAALDTRDVGELWIERRPPQRT